jgi:hypothetical protein
MGDASAAAHEVNDLDDIARGDDVLAVARARYDGAVDLDRHGSFVETEVIDERPDREPVGNDTRCTVDGDLHGRQRSVDGASPPDLRVLLVERSRDCGLS